MADFASAQRRIIARRAAHDATHSNNRFKQAQERSERLASLPPSLRLIALESVGVWDALKSPLGTRPAYRVGQVDAELLDEELLSLLQKQAGQGFRLFGTHLTEEWSGEILALLRLALWKLSIWDHGASYGASLQGLRYVDARANTRSGAEATKLQRAAYGTIAVGGRYLWTRWERHLSAAQSESDESSSLVRRLSYLTTIFESTHNIAAFFSFVVFLYNGRYRTLLDRLLGMRLVPSSNQTNREVSFEFLNRQLVWHAFTEFLLFLLPLVGISRWKRWVARAWKKAARVVEEICSDMRMDAMDGDDYAHGSGELSFLPERTCAICYQDQNPSSGQSEQDIISAGANTGIVGNASTDITNPYETLECRCIYCYVCLAGRIDAEEGEGWNCLRCGHLVKGCRPWNGDVAVPEPAEASIKSANGKTVAWADEIEETSIDDIEPVPADPERDDHNHD